MGMSSETPARDERKKQVALSLVAFLQHTFLALFYSKTAHMSQTELIARKQELKEMMCDGDRRFFRDFLAGDVRTDTVRRRNRNLKNECK